MKNHFPFSEGSASPTAPLRWKWIGAIFGVLLLSPILAIQLLYPVNEWWSYRRYRPSFDEHYDKDILPGAAWVRNHLQTHERLPTPAEYRASRIQAGEFWGSGLTTRSTGFPNVQGNDFMISTGIGEWTLFYQSWDGKRWWQYTE